MEDTRKLAQQWADEFNEKYGAEWLGVVRGHESVSVGELRRLAESQPGTYMAGRLFEHFRGRKPSHAETIAVGKLLAALGVVRTKSGPVTLWRLDKSLADRLS